MTCSQSTAYLFHLRATEWLEMIPTLESEINRLQSQGEDATVHEEALVAIRAKGHRIRALVVKRNHNWIMGIEFPESAHKIIRHMCRNQESS